ncbi:uncharacterized protein LOC130296510 [Hyla sarda]|uniref:uncharacterized protein LOC130296510 n=1 Tax=Hyla sarda TaxID=327740 RepID=UPI0024C44157|nr:uncharacterized protein LOC130296510 [Hyla sarda]XP_056404080.1 uncharacterized protein LOC130296510 [Hyla sarda]XP_056404081.1 uncharacterized protein LOC130296510 [Hyla sarda]XP_056404083.1 uncharacterized protein LOC130296510 [Hyla sarda]
MNRYAEPEHGQEESNSTSTNVPTPRSQDGAGQTVQTPRGFFSSIFHKSEDDFFSRKRPRTLNGPQCLSSTPRHHNATTQDLQRTIEPDRSISNRDAGCLQGPGGHYRTARSGSRVTALYSELVRELEAQIAELHQILASRDEAAKVQECRIQELEKENQELKRHVQTLEEHNDTLSRRGICAIKEGDQLLGPDGQSLGVSDSNVSFLKNLAEFLETKSESKVSPPQTTSTPLPSSEITLPPAESIASPIPPTKPEPAHPNEVTGTPPDGMLQVTGVTSGFQYWMKMDDGGENTIPESCVMWEEPLQETLPDGTPAWASPIESNGRPKLELVPASGVYITYQQLEDLSLIPADKPKLMTRRLLDYFFSRETLARSSATGQRIAHNNTTMEKPLRLPDIVVTAIKAYVTRACGRGCNFNAVINSKCGTSRRAVKKMSIRIDWTEGGAKHCPRPTSKSPAQRLQSPNEKATVTETKATETFITDYGPQNGLQITNC